MCTGFSVQPLSIVSRPYANQSLLEGLWLGGGSNTAQYCFLSPHVQPGNEAVSLLCHFCNLSSPESNDQILNSSSFNVMGKVRFSFSVDDWLVWPSTMHSCAFGGSSDSNDNLCFGSLLSFCASEQTLPTEGQCSRDDDEDGLE